MYIYTYELVWDVVNVKSDIGLGGRGGGHCRTIQIREKKEFVKNSGAAAFLAFGIKLPKNNPKRLFSVCCRSDF